MKGRKTIKKPGFILTFCKCFVIVAAFLALIGELIYTEVRVEYSDKGIKNSTSLTASINNDINAALNKENVTPQDIAKLKQQLVWHYSSTGQCYEVYYNREKVADSSRTMIMHYSPEVMDGEAPLYFFDLADKKYLKYFDTPEVLKYKTVVPVYDFSEEAERLNPKFDEKPVIEIGIKEAYIDIENAKFIPVSCYVLDTKANHSLAISGVTVNIPIDKNSPELKGYTHIQSNGIDNFSGSIDGFEGGDVEYTGHAVSTNDYGIYYGYDCSDMTFVPFETAFKNEITIGICILAVVALGLSLIPAAFVFNGKKRNYEIFEYRRRMTDAMAHDLKTPMAAILTYAENMENHTGTDKQEFYVSKISEKVWQMNKMVNSMLDFSRGENTSVTVKKSPIDIGSVLADAIASNEHEITKRGLKVSYEKAGVTVNTDKELFAQAVGNLINNAALYAKEGSEISVTCGSDKIVITNVTAAAVEDAEALKQPFAKGDESRRNYGSGLGLAIAENNLTMLGYKLDVKSEGDKFVVTVTL